MTKHMSRERKKAYRVLTVLIGALLLVGLLLIGKWIGDLVHPSPATSSDQPSSESASAPESMQPASSEPASSADRTSSELSVSSESSVSSAVTPASSAGADSSQPTSSAGSSVAQTGSKTSTGIYANVTWRSPYAEYADIMKHGRDLMLLNNYYELPLDFKWDLVYWSNGQPVDAMSLNSKEYDRVQAVDRAAYQPLKDLFAAAKADGVPLQMVSAYRSISLQDRLFGSLVSSYLKKGFPRADAIQKANTARTFTGTSEHNTGYGFDILESGNWNLTQSFENTAQFKWLQQHAAEYGFILRYDKTKIDKTGIMYEPWHYRYVGVTHAQQIKAGGMCLEEYIEMLDRR